MALLFDHLFPIPSYTPFYAPRSAFAYRAPVDPFFAPLRSSSLLDEFFAPQLFAFPDLADDIDMDSDSAAEEQLNGNAPLSASAPAALPAAETSVAATEGDSTNPDEMNVEYVDLTDKAEPKSSRPACAALSTEDAKVEDSKAADDDSTAVASPAPAAADSASNAVATAKPRSLLDLHRSIKLTLGDKHSVIKADFSGIPKENIQLDLNNGFLTLKANHTVESRNRHGRVVRRAETISRSFYVGKNIDPASIQATFNNGDFQVTFPKPSSSNGSITIN